MSLNNKNSIIVKYAKFPLSIKNVEIEFTAVSSDIHMYDYKRVMLSDMLEAVGKSYEFDFEKSKRN